MAKEVNKRIVCKRGCVDPTLEVNLVGVYTCSQRYFTLQSKHGSM
jgi:hypothetical protein